MKLRGDRLELMVGNFSGTTRVLMSVDVRNCRITWHRGGAILTPPDRKDPYMHIHGLDDLRTLAEWEGREDIPEVTKTGLAASA